MLTHPRRIIALQGNDAADLNEQKHYSNTQYYILLLSHDALGKAVRTSHGTWYLTLLLFGGGPTVNKWQTIALGIVTNVATNRTVMATAGRRISINKWRTGFARLISRISHRRGWHVATDKYSYISDARPRGKLSIWANLTAGESLMCVGAFTTSAKRQL